MLALDTDHEGGPPVGGMPSRLLPETAVSIAFERSCACAEEGRCPGRQPSSGASNGLDEQLCQDGEGVSFYGRLPGHGARAGEGHGILRDAIE
jgi:hypothetical protein